MSQLFMIESEVLRSSAATLGRKGGQSRSPAKVAAVRANGRKGGRPLGSRDKDTPERLAEAWAAWLAVARNAKRAGLETEERDLSPMYDANTRSIKIRTRRLEKLIAARTAETGR